MHVKEPTSLLTKSREKSRWSGQTVQTGSYIRVLRVTVIKLTFRHPGRPGDIQITNNNNNNVALTGRAFTWKCDCSIICAAPWWICTFDFNQASTHQRWDLAQILSGSLPVQLSFQQLLPCDEMRFVCVFNNLIHCLPASNLPVVFFV